jgi:hypothetical protein
MAIEHTILFTVMPRGITAGDTMPVSVFVSPRLQGAKRLDKFRDWLHWTSQLKDSALSLEFHCKNKT